ncbi:MAG: hypothetical protein C4542_08460 [Dehalococcoidia bacterium]|nr:MAG: hypothetical protein C4542_08460 [Dehalococcoidia bacterium]
MAQPAACGRLRYRMQIRDLLGVKNTTRAWQRGGKIAWSDKKRVIDTSASDGWALERAREIANTCKEVRIKRFNKDEPLCVIYNVAS